MVGQEHRDLDVEQSAVLAFVHALQSHRVALAGQRDCVALLLRSLCDVDIANRQLPQFVRRVAQVPARGGVRVADRAGVPLDPEHRAGVLEHLHVEGHLLLVPDVRGDVAVSNHTADALSMDELRPGQALQETSVLEFEHLDRLFHREGVELLCHALELRRILYLRTDRFAQAGRGDGPDLILAQAPDFRQSEVEHDRAVRLQSQDGLAGGVERRQH